MARPADAADLGAVARLYYEIWHETHAGLMPAEEARLRTHAFFVERMAGLLPRTVVVDRDGVVVGFAAWTGTLLGQLYVEDAHRGLGIAVTLLAETERRMAAEGIETSELHCLVGNERARRFYERMGWQHAGTVSEAVAGPNGAFAAAFWRMTKSLGPGARRS